MFVFCAGMRRSASTLQYQLAKNIIEEVGTGVAIGWQIHQDFYKLKEQWHDYNGYIILKCHSPFYDIDECKVFTVHRDIRDIVVSLMNKYDMSFDEALRDIPDTLKEYEFWSNVSGAYITSYDKLINDITGETKRMAEYLDIDINIKQALEIAERYSLDKQVDYINNFDWQAHGDYGNNWQYDPDTLLHVNHIIDGTSGQWKTRLLDYQVKEIEDMAGDWLERYGYL